MNYIASTKKKRRKYQIKIVTRATGNECYKPTNNVTETSFTSAWGKKKGKRKAKLTNQAVKCDVLDIHVTAQSVFKF